jgi:hypothetical protein
MDLQAKIFPFIFGTCTIGIDMVWWDHAKIDKHDQGEAQSQDHQRATADLQVPPGPRGDPHATTTQDRGRRQPTKRDCTPRSSPTAEKIFQPRRNCAITKFAERPREGPSPNKSQTAVVSRVWQTTHTTKSIQRAGQVPFAKTLSPATIFSLLQPLSWSRLFLWMI